jgi:hypothetical protein
VVGVGKGERKDRDPRCSWATLGLLGIRERESWERDGVGRWAGRLGGRRLVGGPFCGRRLVRWTVERGRFGKWPELVGGKEQWPANCSGRRTSVVVGGGDGVSF